MEQGQPLSSRPRSRRLGAPPQRIAFVVDWLEDPYQGAVLRGAAEAAHLRGGSLVVLPGGILGETHHRATLRNQIYELLNTRYAGMIVMTGTLGERIGKDIVASLCAEFPRSKVCSIGVALDSSASVLIDNRRGMQSALEHLIREHKARRIAFIRGPRTNVEAEERYWAYQDVLEAHGLAQDEQLVCTGDFQRATGVEAVKSLLDDRGIAIDEIDAIAAADDLMALGALDELSARGIRVPEDIALTGFDDIELAKYSNPPLTSVGQPFDEQGREAVRAVLSGQVSGAAPEPLLVATTDHIRRSCGCIPDDDTFYTDRPPATSNLGLEASLIRQRSLILAQLTRAGRGTVTNAGRDWEVTLYNSLHDELKGQAGAFRHAFNAFLERVLASGGDISVGHALITGLRSELCIAAGESASQLRTVESLFHDARVLTSHVMERSQAARRLKVENWARVLAETSAKLIAATSLSELATTVYNQLPRLGIPSCYISRYSPEHREESELMIGFGPWGRLSPDAEPLLFPSADLVPQTLFQEDRTRSLVVQPLATDAEIYGFAVFEYGDAEPYVYEVLRELLTAALRTTLAPPLLEMD